MKNNLLMQNSHDSTMIVPRQYRHGLFPAVGALFSPIMTVGRLPIRTHTLARVRVLFILFTLLLGIKERKVYKIIAFFAMILLSCLDHATVIVFFPLDGAPW